MACAGDFPRQDRWGGAYLRECLLQCCIGFIQVVIDDHQVKQAWLLAWGGTRDRVRNTGDGPLWACTTVNNLLSGYGYSCCHYSRTARAGQNSSIPLLDNLSWGLLPSSRDYWGVDYCPCPGLSELALPVMNCHTHRGKQQKVSTTVHVGQAQTQEQEHSAKRCLQHSSQ